MAFFGPGPFDIVCIGRGGQIVASGSEEKMRHMANANNYGMARLVPMRYSTVPRELVGFMSDDEYNRLVDVTNRANEDLDSQPRPWTEICKKKVRVSRSKQGTSRPESSDIVTQLRTGKFSR